MGKIENRMIGVGCFARQPTLGRVLGRMVEAWALDDGRAPEAEGAHASAGRRALRDLVSGRTTLEGIAAGGGAEEKVAGFFLGFENRGLKLSVFTRRGGTRCGEYETSLRRLGPLRRARLT